MACWVMAFVVVAAAGADPALASPAVAQLPAAPMFQWRPFLGPFHSLLLHYPIGFLTMAFVLELYQLRRPSIELARVTRLVVWLSLGSGLLAAGLGIMRAASGGYDDRAVTLHRAFGMAVPVMTLLTLVAHKFSLRPNHRPAPVWIYRTSLVTTLGLLVVAGHFGGNLTHGSKYLVQNAPSFVRDLLEPGSSVTGTSTNGVGNESQRLYVETVGPALASKCVRCHGPEKQKGGYRLDTPERAFAGGESDLPAIKPGDPMHSNLLRLILLPPSHDDVMPPEGRDPLTPAEIMAIAHWIQSGAGWVQPAKAELAETIRPEPRQSTNH